MKKTLTGLAIICLSTLTNAADAHTNLEKTDIGDYPGNKLYGTAASDDKK